MRHPRLIPYAELMRLAATDPLVALAMELAAIRLRPYFRRVDGYPPGFEIKPKDKP